MIAFEIAIDGKRVCTAGVGDAGVLSAVASWVRRDSRDGHTGDEVAGQFDEELEFDVGGLVRDSDGAVVNLAWLKRTLNVGQQITLTVVEVLQSDPPQTRRRQDLEHQAERRREYYERLKREYGDA